MWNIGVDDIVTVCKTLGYPTGNPLVGTGHVSIFLGAERLLPSTLPAV
jgi:hypothetical protein